MKRVDKITYLVLGFIVLCLIFGCLDGKPSSWNVKEEKWEVWKEGKIVSLKDVKKGATVYAEITFTDGVSITMGAIKDQSRIGIGSTGMLYKHNFGNEDKISWFQWINSEDTKAGIVKVKEEPIKDNIIEKITDPPKRYDWQNIITSPPAYQTVLVKFKNGLTTTAYQTPTEKWKADTDRKKLSGGIALKEVSQWKFVDLE